MTFDLSPLQKYLHSPGVLALTVDGGNFSVRVVTSNGEPASSFSLPLPDDSESPQKIGRELASKLEAAGIRQRQCVASIPASWALSTSADLPEVNDDDLRGYFELRAEREFSTSGLRLAHNRYRLADGTQRATLVGVPGKRIEAVEQLLAAAGCRIVSLSLALDGALAATEPTLHFLVRRDGLDLLVSAGGGIALLRSLAAGLDGTALAREVRMTLGRLPESIRSQLHAARWVGAPLPGLREILEPMGITNLSEPAETGVSGAEESAALYLKKSPVPFEFVIPEVNRWPERFERFNTYSGRRIAAATAGVIGVLLLTFLVRSHMERSLQSEWNGMSGRVADLDGIQQNVRHFRPWFTGAPQKLQALETLFAAFPERGEIWARSVQAGAYLEKNDKRSRGGAVQNTEAVKVSVSGCSRSQAALTSLQDHLRKEPGVSTLQLQQQRGNNPIQFSLTFKWEPKHDN